jgi:periplasmic protein TonB
MRWLLFAAVLSFLFHGLFFTFHLDWIKESRMIEPKVRTISVELSYKKPDRPSFVQKAHPVQKPTEKKKNSPQKNISRPIPQKAEPVPEKISPQTDERSIQEESFDDLSGQNMSTEQNSYNPGRLSGSSDQIPDQGISAVYEREAIPAYKDNPPPTYPVIARRKGYQGTVILEVLVNQNGKVDDLRVYQSSGYPSLDDAASTSVFQWTFLPGMKDNKPVGMWVKLPVRFQLQ